jgi:signal transduction histidine kinase
MGFINIASYGLILIYLVPTLFSIIIWSIYIVVPMVALAVILVMAGILIDSSFAVFLTVVITIFIVILTILQQYLLIPVDISWMKDVFIYPPDAVVLGLLFIVLLTISWISNHQIELLLNQLLMSQKHLKDERDHFEEKVFERTEEVHRLEAEKIAQVYKFALLGKLTSSIIHDVVNPLTTISYNLNELSTRKASIQRKEIQHAGLLISDALTSTKQLERFIQIVRKQIQHRSDTQYFVPIDEINETIELFSHSMKSHNITLSCSYETNHHYFGNPIRFSQMISNLISNAIDALKVSNKSQKHIMLNLGFEHNHFILSVADNGSGMKEEVLAHAFEPLYTTKLNPKKSGLGLSIVKDIVEYDLKGNIYLESNTTKGTSFLITFPRIYPTQSSDDDEEHSYETEPS